MNSFDEAMMREALRLAEDAARRGESPIGAVVVLGAQVIGRGQNRCEEKQSAMAHAEMIALEEATRAKGSWRLDDCTLYVTMEPCPMCAGALIHSRIGRVVFGVADPRAGSLGSLINLNAYPYHRHVTVEGGLLSEESGALLTSFFEERRKKGKKAVKNTDSRTEWRIKDVSE